MDSGGSMRLLMVASNFPPVLGGIQTYAHELARSLRASGCELSVLAPRVAGARAFDRASPLDIARLASFGDDLAVSGIAPLARELRRTEYDAAFATHWAPGFALLCAARLAGRVLPVFVAAHGKELIHRPWARFALAQRVYDAARGDVLLRATGFFPVSTRTGELLRDAGVDAARICVVHNGVDPARFRPAAEARLKAELGVRGPMLLSVARLVRRKGLDTVLAALPAVLATAPALGYVIVGEGPDRARLSGLARELGVADHVHFVARAGDELVRYYNACDLFVMPARDEPGDIEGFGLVFLEAGACEKAVIGARAGGVGDAIQHGVTGLLVAPDDPAALARAITGLLADPERAAELGRAAREHVERAGTWQHAGAAILREITARSGARRLD